MKDRIRATGVAVVLLIIFFGIATLDYNFGRRYFLSVGHPVYSTYFALRMVAAIAIAMILAMLAAGWNGGMLLMRLDPPWPGFSLGFAYLCLGGAAGAAVLLAVSPAVFNHLVLEDSYVEWCSALVLLATSALMLGAARPLLTRRDKPAAVAVLIAGAVLFVIAMEEISWMQRLIGFQTPGFLAERNLQGEANIHNLYTNLSENLYYGGAFGLLVLLPSLAFLFRPGAPLAAFSLLMPSRYALLVGALGTAFAYEMWNVFWIEMAFFYGVLLLGGLAGEAVRLKRHRDALLFTCAGLALVGVQLASLHYGRGMVRRWDDKEFKELIVAAGLLLHAAEVYLRVRAPAWLVARLLRAP